MSDLQVVENESLEQKVIRLEKEVDFYKSKVLAYEQNGGAKAAYAINRKLNELSDMLNRTNVADIDIADAKDKSFERLKAAWGEMASLGDAYKTLALSAGVTGDESKDISRKPFVDTIAEKRS